MRTRSPFFLFTVSSSFLACGTVGLSRGAPSGKPAFDQQIAYCNFDFDHSVVCVVEEVQCKVAGGTYSCACPAQRGNREVTLSTWSGGVVQASTTNDGTTARLDIRDQAIDVPPPKTAWGAAALSGCASLPVDLPASAYVDHLLAKGGVADLRAFRARFGDQVPEWKKLAIRLRALEAKLEARGPAGASTSSSGKSEQTGVSAASNGLSGHTAGVSGPAAQIDAQKVGQTALAPNDAARNRATVVDAIARAKALNDAGDGDGARAALNGLPWAGEDLDRQISTEFNRALHPHARSHQAHNEVATELPPRTVDADWEKEATAAMTKATKIFRTGDMEGATQELEAVAPGSGVVSDSKTFRDFTEQLRDTKTATLMRRALKHGNKPHQEWLDLYQLYDDERVISIDPSFSAPLKTLLQSAVLPRPHATRFPPTPVVVRMTDVENMGVILVDVRMTPGPLDGSLEERCVGTGGLQELERRIGRNGALVMNVLCPQVWESYVTFALSAMRSISEKLRVPQDVPTWNSWDLAACEVRAWTPVGDYLALTWDATKPKWSNLPPASIGVYHRGERLDLEGGYGNYLGQATEDAHGKRTAFGVLVDLASENAK